MSLFPTLSPPSLHAVRTAVAKCPELGCQPRGKRREKLLSFGGRGEETSGRETKGSVMIYSGNLQSEIPPPPLPLPQVPLAALLGCVWREEDSHLTPMRERRTAWIID